MRGHDYYQDEIDDLNDELDDLESDLDDAYDDYWLEQLFWDYWHFY